mmetsp:Transcript_22007/g.74603  ORF Transcript_22007/g.74603 Transcript_22007/m.74603 type:complete len:272 (+) Transcript_22007:3516-4331(+)
MSLDMPTPSVASNSTVVFGTNAGSAKYKCSAYNVARAPARFKKPCTNFFSSLAAASRPTISGSAAGVEPSRPSWHLKACSAWWNLRAAAVPLSSLVAAAPTVSKAPPRSASQGAWLATTAASGAPSRNTSSNWPSFLGIEAPPPPALDPFATWYASHFKSTHSPCEKTFEPSSSASTPALFFAPSGDAAPRGAFGTRTPGSAAKALGVKRERTKTRIDCSSTWSQASLDVAPYRASQPACRDSRAARVSVGTACRELAVTLVRHKSSRKRR